MHASNSLHPLVIQAPAGRCWRGETNHARRRKQRTSAAKTTCRCPEPAIVNTIAII